MTTDNLQVYLFLLEQVQSCANKYLHYSGKGHYQDLQAATLKLKHLRTELEIAVSNASAFKQTHDVELAHAPCPDPECDVSLTMAVMYRGGYWEQVTIEVQVDPEHARTYHYLDQCGRDAIWASGDYEDAIGCYLFRWGVLGDD